MNFFPYQIFISRVYRAFMVLLLSAILQISAFSQDSAQVRQWMTTLSSPSFFGRGYYQNGMGLAAQYISNELGSMGLSVQKQPFRYDANVFDGKMELKVNGKLLKPGTEFLVAPNAMSYHGKVSLVKVDSTIWITENRKLVLQLTDKLTWSVAPAQGNFCMFQVSKTVLGFEPKNMEAKVESKLVKDFEAANLMAVVKGTIQPDSMLVFTAHYDHLGQMGKNTIFSGANDNASGTSLLLALAKEIALKPLPYTAVFIFFAGEEMGLAGSEYFANHPLVELSKIRFLLNLDLMGNGDDGITVVNATEFPAAFDLLQKINSEDHLLTAINSRGKAKNSDHYWFTEKGVPSFFWYTLGKRKAYHDVEDVASTVPLYEADDLLKLIIRFSNGIIKLPPQTK